jgi:hypothetical protein
VAKTHGWRGNQAVWHYTAIILVFENLAVIGMSVMQLSVDPPWTPQFTGQNLSPEHPGKSGSDCIALQKSVTGSEIDTI